MKMTMEDDLKKNTTTVVEIDEIKFGVEIEKGLIGLEFVENVP